MPISQILPDGRVRIVNSKTGQTKDVKPEELGSYSPRLVTDYQEALQKRQSIESAAKAISGGQLKIADIPTEQRADVATNLSEMGYVPPEAAAQKKKTDSGREILNFINNLEKHYQGAGGASFGSGPLARIQGGITGISGNLGLNDAASLYGNQKEGFAATLKSLTGDTGVLTDEDYKRLSKILPGLGATEGEAKGAFNDLRSQLAAKTGSDQTETTINPKYRGPSGNQIIDMFLGNAIKTAKDVGAGITANQTEEARNVATKQDFAIAQRLEDQASRETNKQKKMELLKQAQQIYSQQSNNAGEVANSFSSDVKQNPLWRGAKTGYEVASTAALVTGLPSAVKGIKNIAKNGVQGLSKKSIGTARDAAAAAIEKPVSTKSLLEAGDKYVIRDPTANRLWTDVLRPALAKQPELKVPDLLKQIGVWNDAYTNAGKVGKTALAGLNDALARAGKEIIKQEAPEVAKYTADFARLFGIEKNISRFAPAAIGAGGGVVGATIVGKALGQK